MSVSVKNRPYEKGVVLLLVTVILGLIGVGITLGLGVFDTEDPEDRILETTKKQEFVINQLSAYVQRENRLPCPADPSVDKMTAAFGIESASCPTEGIVPFRTLNIVENYAIDSWGNYMTYKISPVLANTPTTRNVFMRCRLRAWYEDSPGINVFPEKSLFCCPPIDGGYSPASDLRIFSSMAALAADDVISDLVRQGVATHYDDVDVSLPATATLPVNEEFFAVAIISHGANGVGAFLANGTVDRLPGGVGAAESENLDGDRDVIAQSLNMSSAADNLYFDDLVIWRSQLTLMGELNNATCYLPWR